MPRPIPANEEQQRVQRAIVLGVNPAAVTGATHGVNNLPLQLRDELSQRLPAPASPTYLQDLPVALRQTGQTVAGTMAAATLSSVDQLLDSVEAAQQGRNPADPWARFKRRVAYGIGVLGIAAGVAGYFIGKHTPLHPMPVYSTTPPYLEVQADGKWYDAASATAPVGTYALTFPATAGASIKRYVLDSRPVADRAYAFFEQARNRDTANLSGVYSEGKIERALERIKKFDGKTDSISEEDLRQSEKALERNDFTLESFSKE